MADFILRRSIYDPIFLSCIMLVRFSANHGVAPTRGQITFVIPHISLGRAYCTTLIASVDPIAAHPVDVFPVPDFFLSRYVHDPDLFLGLRRRGGHGCWRCGRSCRRLGCGSCGGCSCRLRSRCGRRSGRTAGRLAVRSMGAARFCGCCRFRCGLDRTAAFCLRCGRRAARLRAFRPCVRFRCRLSCRSGFRTCSRFAAQCGTAFLLSYRAARAACCRAFRFGILRNIVSCAPCKGCHEHCCYYNCCKFLFHLNQLLS